MMATPKLARIFLTDLNVAFYIPVSQQTEFHLTYESLPPNIKKGIINLVMNHQKKGEYYVIDEINHYLSSHPEKALQEINFILRNSSIIEPKCQP
jgi:hypothetical protein